MVMRFGRCVFSLSVALPFLVAACTGEIGAGLLDAPPPPDVEPKAVPTNPDALSADEWCVPLGADEKLLGVSPEGHAWLSSTTGGVTSIRVLDPVNPMAEIETVDLELGTIVDAVILSEDDAAILTEDIVWRIEDFGRIQLGLPPSFTSPQQLCGDPAINGFFLANNLVFERRVDDQFWIWDPGGSGAQIPDRFLKLEGECESNDGRTWMTSPDGTLWEIESSLVDRPIKFTSFVEGAVTGSSVAMLETDKLWFGPTTWQPWSFADGIPAHVEAAGGYFWMVSNNRLLRSDGTTFEEVTHAAGSISDVKAHDHGVWVVGDTDVCHEATSTPLRVEGLRPYTRSFDDPREFVVRAADALADVSATLDGEEVLLTQDLDGSWVGDATLASLGWHELVVTADGTNQATRTIPVKLLPIITRSWEQDIKPIYLEHCSSPACHSGGNANPPDLSTYGRWQQYGNGIRQRVVKDGNMPPAASRLATWGTDQVEVISQWIEGGMLP